MFTLRAARTSAFVLLIFVASGCRTRPATLDAWQNRVQSYVVDQGNGDMNCLREAHITPGQRGFRIFSSDDVAQSTDFVGVLVGVHQTASRMWYVYLVGEVGKEELKTTRLAALSQMDGQFTWRMGEEDRVATAAYRQHEAKAWSERTGAGSPPRGVVSFPNPGDHIELNGGGETVVVRETASGVQWTLNLAATR